MSYTPTNWQTGDTITAEKMNNLENGVSNAQNVAVVTLDAEGFGTSSHLFGYMVYATYDGEKWILISDNDGTWVNMWGYEKPLNNIIPPQYALVSSNMCPIFVNGLGNDVDIEITGDIEETENLYFNYGSLVMDAYRIYGNGSIKIIAL